MASEEVDDTDSRFDYKDDAWSSGGETGDFDGTSHSTETAGAQVIFGPFTGTSVTVFSTFDTSQPKVHFFVDDGAQNSVVSAESSQITQFQVPVYSATSLDPSATHTLQINVLDAGPFTLDYVLIGNGASTTSSSILNGSPTASSTTPSTTPSSLTTTFSSFSTPLSVFTRQTSTSATSLSVLIGHTFTSSTAAPAATSLAMSTSSSPGPDATIIGAVVGSVVFIAVVVISLFVFLRKRRRSSSSTKYAVPSSKRKSEWTDSRPPYRPSLHLSIPSTLTLPRGVQKTMSFLPTYDRSAASSSRHSLLHSSGTGSTSGRPKPAFLENDPSQDESPIFDIKKRPVSGSTMTTRVTVGTSVGQRSSVPESAYHQYQYSEQSVPVPVPPLPVLPPLAVLQRSKSRRLSNDESSEDTHSQTEYEAAFSALQSYSSDMGSRSGPIPTSLYPSQRIAASTEPASGSGMGLGLGLGTTGSGTTISVPRRLPLTPVQLQRQDSHGFGEDEKDNMRSREDTKPIGGHQSLSRSPFEGELIVHQDEGVQLDYSSPQPTPVRRELPPPYANLRL